MESQKDISKSVYQTIIEIKSRYRSSKLINELYTLDSETKNRSKMEGRELSEWNAVISKKCRQRFDSIVRSVCKRNGRNEDHVRRVAGWKRGRNITNLNIKENE